MTIPEPELEETRAALAPTLEATASILPLVAKPRTPRFESQLAERWQVAWSELAAAWSDRNGTGFARIRPTVFALCGIALELADPDCLRLTEALASATDCLDTAAGTANPRTITAISAAVECFAEAGSIEHDAFAERARHFARRLEQCAAEPAGVTPPRSAVLDRLFADEARECLERMRDACAALPPDPYGLKGAAADLNRVAEALELEDIALVASRLVRSLTLRAGERLDLEAPATHDTVAALISDLEKAVAALGSTAPQP